MTVRLVRYASRGAFADRRPFAETVAPMGAGSVVGAVIGGALVGIVPIPVLKFGLGIILNVSAWADVQAQALSGRRAPVHHTFEGSRRAP